MRNSRKLWTRVALIGVLSAALGALPAASPADTGSDACTISVTLVTGQHLSFTVDVPPGTPLSAISLPVTVAVATVSENCASAPTTTSATGTTPTGTTTTATTTTGTQTTPAKNPATVPAQTTPAPLTAKPQQASQAKPRVWGKRPTSTPTVTKLSGANGTPSPNNPTYSFALPGAAPLGVPNFFIDDFQIPPFLLPIYQAAGIEYDVPWQILAAINWIETDYGRDLSVSSAGAMGWMQFLPSTWRRWGVDATGSGYADPYNPTDAIFTAARYLQAAGAAQHLSQAIFAYNHAGWYVQSVLLRAQLIGGMPPALVGALTGLVEGHFPVAAPAKYADSSVTKLARMRIHGANAALPIQSTAATGTAIYAKPGAPVIAVNDGKVVRIGYSRRLGHYLVLQDGTGNTYTYSNLGSIPALYPVPKPVTTSPGQLRRELSVVKVGPTGTLAPASAGLQPGTSPQSLAGQVSVVRSTAQSAVKPSSSPLTVRLTRPVRIAHPRVSAPVPGSRAARTHTVAVPAALPKERLFANPANPVSYRAGGAQQLASEAQDITDFQNYFSDVLHLARNQYTLAPLTRGSIVVAGTVLGRIGTGTATQAPHLYFQVQPAGQNAPFIDPKPILDGWKLLEATAVYRAAGINAFFGPQAKQATIGQILLESKAQLQERVLADPHVQIYACGRRDIQSGAIDRRILATIAFLSASGLDPTVSGLACDAGHNGIDAAGQTGASMDISAINNIPIAGHQGTGSITDITIRRLLTLQGALAPAQIISEMSYKGQANTLSLPDHANRIQVSFTPQFGADRKLSREIRSVLKPDQWIQLIQHIGQIPEPTVPVKPSVYAIKR